jgi:hypothetical protein
MSTHQAISLTDSEWVSHWLSSETRTALSAPGGEVSCGGVMRAHRRSTRGQTPLRAWRRPRARASITWCGCLSGVERPCTARGGTLWGRSARPGPGRRPAAAGPAQRRPAPGPRGLERPPKQAGASGLGVVHGPSARQGAAVSWPGAALHGGTLLGPRGCRLDRGRRPGASARLEACPRGWSRSRTL